MNIKKAQKVYFDLGYFRILQSLSDLQPLDIYIDDKLVAQNLFYKSYTPYFPMVEDSYRISLYPAGTKDTPVLTNTLTIEQREFLTLATDKTPSGISFLAIPDINMPLDPSKAMIRFLHLSPNTPAVDITLLDGTILFSDITYGEGTSYFEVDPGNYTLQVREAGTPSVILTVPNINLDPNSIYTVYAVGLFNESPELEALFLLDGFK